MAATATYGQRFSDNAEWYATASFQHVGNRYTQPGDQEPGAGLFSTALFFDPTNGAFGSGVNDFGSLRLPAYELVNLSAGIKWDSGLEVVAYVNNLFDTNAKLSFDRERGGRARLGYNVGTPRIDRPDAAQAVRRGAPLRRRRRRRLRRRLRRLRRRRPARTDR